MQQQQQHAYEETEKLNKKIQVRKNRIKELWWTNCEQLTEYDQTLLDRKEKLQTLSNILQIRHSGNSSLSEPTNPESLFPHLVWPTDSYIQHNRIFPPCYKCE